MPCENRSLALQSELSITSMWQPEAPGAPRGLPLISSLSDVANTYLLDASDAVATTHRLPLDQPVTQLTLGKRIPGTRLRLISRIGDGAYGVVYRGEHVDLQRALAIKVLRADAEDPEAKQRFLTEARTTTKIDSPYVVDVVDFGALPDGRVWYAMEFLEGQPLDEVMEGRALDPARVVTLLRMACKGLAAAHRLGIVHRDIKPANLVLVDRGGREHLVIVDFGIATDVGIAPEYICGTPEYMAPEQVDGGALDCRTDVYSLGCCAYEMLAGARLVDAATPQAAIMQHADGVNVVFPRDTRAPRALREVVKRCLACDPANRFASMEELEAALCEAAIESSIVDLRPDLEPPHVAEPKRSRLIAGLSQTDRSVPRRRGIAVGTGLVAAAFVMVIANWAQAEQLQVVRSVVASAARAVARPIAGIAESVRSPAPERSTMDLVVIAQAEPEPEQAAAVSSPKQVRRVRATGSGTPAVPERGTARYWTKQGHQALRRGDREEAEEAFRQALQISPNNESALAGLSDVYFERGRHEQALDYASRAVESSPKSRLNRIRLGDAYYRVGRQRDARKQYERARVLGSKVAAGRIEAMGAR